MLMGTRRKSRELVLQMLFQSDMGKQDAEHVRRTFWAEHGTASAEVRAKRRKADLEARGEDAEFSDVLAQQNKRDESDASRSVGPLVPAADAITFYTDGMTADEVEAAIGLPPGDYTVFRGS